MSFWDNWSDGKKWGMGILAAIIVMSITGTIQWFKLYWQDQDAVVITLNSARPKATSIGGTEISICLLYTSPSPRDLSTSRMPSSA